MIRQSNHRQQVIGESTGNQVNKALSTAHQRYCAHLFDNAHSNNNKRFWSLVKQFRKDHQSVATLCVENELMITPSSKAEALNHQFYSVFTRENSDTPLINFPKYSNMANIQKLLSLVKLRVQTIFPHRY